MIRKTFLALPALAMMAACAAPTLDDYRPVTDPSAAAAGRYEADLAQCQAVAKQAEVEYQKRQQSEMMGNLIGGLIVGAVVGQAVGGNSDWTAYGAASGAASGVAATDTELAHGGPRRLIDRCMTSRGHTVLSDLGKG